MPVNVRIVQGLQEAAEILASDRGAQLLGGGTLLVRAINEGTMTEGTLLRRSIRCCWRSTPAARGLNSVPASPWRWCWRTVTCPICTHGARHRRPRGANHRDHRRQSVRRHALWRFHHRAAGARRCRHAACRFRRRAGDAAEEMLANRARGGVGLVASVGFSRPAGADAFRFVKVARCGPRASRCSRSQRICRRTADGSAARGSPMARWGGAAARQAVERVLEGRSLDAATIAAAKTAALEGTQPATDAIASGMVSPRSIACASRPAACRRDILKERRMARMPVQFRLNGSDRAVFVESGGNAARHHQARARRFRAEIRLRPGHLRRLHRAGRWRAAIGLPHAQRDLRGAIDRNRKWARRRADAASAAGRLHGRISPRNAVSARRAC